MTEPLGHHVDLMWPADPGAPGGKRNRRGGPYRAFIPARIAEREFLLSSDSADATARASRALGELAHLPDRLASVDALARYVIRSESVASSRIEGLEISQRRLARAQFASAHGRGVDSRAAEVIGNVRAMERAIKVGAAGRRVDPSAILKMHKHLLATAGAAIAGKVRTKQNWIGGNAYNPLDADYVPPPPQHVDDLLADLCEFINRDDLPAVAHAAIAHAQFENIHPFADGNGRVGRALVYTMLRRRDEIGEYVPPLSLVVAGRLRAYVAAIGAYSSGDVGPITQFFGDVTVDAVARAGDLADAVERLQAGWIEQLGSPRTDAVVRRIIAELPAHPVIDVTVAMSITGRSHVAVGSAIRQLTEIGVLTQLNEKKWGRVWECRALLDLATELEASGASA